MNISIDILEEYYNDTIDMLNEEKEFVKKCLLNPELIFQEFSKDKNYLKLINISDKFSQFDMQLLILDYIKKYLGKIDKEIQVELIDEHYHPSDFGVFYNGEYICRFNIYNHEFENLWEKYKEDYNVDTYKKELNDISEEIDKYTNYLNNPSLFVKDICTKNIFYNIRNYLQYLFYKDKMIYYFNNQINIYNEKYDKAYMSFMHKQDSYNNFIKIRHVLEQKYKLFEDLFITKFNYSYRTQSYGNSYSFELAKKVGKVIK